MSCEARKRGSGEVQCEKRICFPAAVEENAESGVGFNGTKG